MRERRDQQTRRRLIGAGLAFGGLMLSRATVASDRSDTNSYFEDPRLALDAYIKLRGSTANETTYVAYDGDIVGVKVRGESIPLVSFRGITKSHWRRDGNGGYTNTDYDIGVFVDSQSGEVLKTWRNPLTGEDVEVIHYISGPSGGHFKAGIEADDPYGGGIGRWGQSGNRIWQTSVTSLSWPNALSKDLHPRAWSGKQVHTSMSTTYSGTKSEVLDPEIHSVESMLVWNDILSPSPWMRMAQLPIMCDWRMIGGKVLSTDDLDPSLVAEVEAVVPGYISQDTVWSKPSGGWNQYLQRYPDGENPA